jgi:hypothetical protein
MIVGVPEFAELNDTAVGWLNLVWEIAIREVSEFQEADFLFRDIEAAHGHERVEEEAQKYWNNARYKLNNAVSLLQQSLEIELKARIAKLSPYLLIAGDPQSWPKMDKVGQVDFSDFKTLDSIHLCRVHNIVSDCPLPLQFMQFYNDARRARNKIAHLNAGNMKAESSGILLAILTAHGYLYEKGKWMDFRRQYMLIEQKSGPDFDYDEDFTNDNLNREFDAARWELEPRHLREFFGYDVRKRGWCASTVWISAQTGVIASGSSHSANAAAASNVSYAPINIPTRNTKSLQTRPLENLRNRNESMNVQHRPALMGHRRHCH